MTTWAELERRLHADRKWKRQGREWRGPCPVTGAGTDTAYAKEADRITNGILLGCHRCHPFDRQAFIDHLNALMPERTRRPAAGYGGPPAKPRSGKPLPKTGAARRPRRSRLHERIWRAGVPPAGTPAERYLVDRRACWRPGDVLPPSIRWLPAASPAWRMLRPAGPLGVAGAVLYAFIGAVDRRLGAVQAEGLDGDGNRQEWAKRLKRVSIAGSRFEHGAQRFEAVYHGPKAPVLLVEGPTSALAVPQWRRNSENEWTIAGTNGWTGMTTAAVGAAPTVWIVPDGDAVSLKAARALAKELEEAGRAASVLPLGEPGDVAALVNRTKAVTAAYRGLYRRP